MDSLIMLPDDPQFNAILAMNPPPDTRGNNELGARVAVIGADGMPRGVSSQRELDDYLFGGEWELVDPQPEEDEEEDEECL